LRRDGEFVKTLPSVTIGNDVDAMPLPARELTAHDRSRYFIDWMKPVALVRTTLGCPYRCSFCSIWKAMDGRYAMRKIDDVVAELATIEEEWVFLIDDEAFINRARMLELAAALERAGVRKRFFTYCRIDTLLKHTDAIVAWQRIGLERLFIGIDAVSPKDLDEYHKRTDLAQIEEGLRLADRLGISIFAQFVVNTDYTARDFVRLQRWVEHNRVAYPSFTVLTPLPGTELLPNFDNVVERQPNGRPNWDLFDCQNAVVPTALPKDEFRAHYRGLYSIFKGAYLPYREHNYLIDEDAIVARSFV
jgi:methyltransferase